MEESTGDKNTLVSQAAELIKQSACCVALTGAGISTPSGIPDFRSPGSGIWTKYSPMEVASLSAFRYHPDRFYNWLRPFAGKIYQAAPNSAHLALADLEKKGFLAGLITQNIDGLHQKAGSRQVIEVHGSFRTLSCPGCFHQATASESMLKDFIDGGSNPRCSQCGRILKPDIILYEEQLPAQAWKAAREQIAACDMLLILGSSLTVTPTCDLPYSALGQGAKLVILNRTKTHLDDQAAVTIQGDLASLLPMIAEKIIDEEK
jgi:NAD-dependent deacetylase